MPTDLIPFPPKMRPKDHSLAFNKHGFDFLLAAIEAETGITREAIRGRGRKEPIAHARQLFFFMVRHHLTDDEGRAPSYTAIGQAFRRDHCTIIHAAQVTRDRIRLWPRYSQTYRAICLKLTLTPAV